MTGEAVGGLSNFTSPIDHSKMRNPYMVAEQEFRTTTPESASSAQRQSATQSEAAAPATPSLTTTTKHSRDAGEYHVGHTLR